MAQQSGRQVSEGKRVPAPPSSSLLGSPSPSTPAPRPTSTDERPLSEVRLFVANLAPSVSEHDLMTAFKAHGTLRKLDLVFHRSGPQKGQHKGFAFIEYADAQHAKRARTAMNGKPLRGRELHVHYATVAATSEASTGVGAHRRPRQHATDDTANNSTMLSLVKNLNRKDSTSTRIAAMEAKLEAIRNRKEAAALPSSVSLLSSSSNATAARPSHLPNKPPSSMHR